MNYDEACAQAATDQGLDPIMAQLRSAGIEHWLYQSGGFCMIVAISHGDEEIYMTSGAETFGERDDEVYVQRNTAEMLADGCYGDEPAHYVTLAELPSLIRQLTTEYVQ